MLYSIEKISKIIKAKPNIHKNIIIEYLITDTRKAFNPQSSLFFALTGPIRNGHAFIAEAYRRGIRAFITHSGVVDVNQYQEAIFLEVPSVLEALQTLATFHRQQFHYPVIGITGSNGKTVVKEWLFQLLQNDYRIVRSPRSYNSQIGVPLSIWQMNHGHTLAIFEAGISKRGEMEKLEKIIQPTIGVFTNIGDAHNEGFDSQTQKAVEKFELFKQAEYLVCNASNEIVYNLISNQIKTAQNQHILSWGYQKDLTLQLQSIARLGTSSSVSYLYKNEYIELNFPFTDDASIENCITCLTVMLQLGYDIETIQSRIALLQPVELRMQMVKGINNCTIINDSYSNDLISLQLAVSYLTQQSGKSHKTIILSDVFQTGMEGNTLYEKVAQLFKSQGVDLLIAIGQEIGKTRIIFEAYGIVAQYYPTTKEFINKASHNQFHNQYILLKGARSFSFEKIAVWFDEKVHGAVLEINLSALSHNLRQFQQIIKPETKLMAMVKAYGYGSGSAEVAKLLQFNKVDYLSVAYPDEGADLRMAGISLPIMVMASDASGFDSIIEHQLEPEIFSFSILNAFVIYLKQQGIEKYPVHIKINTGMNRLGFDPSDIVELCNKLSQWNLLSIQSVFSHFVGSENPEHDPFTHQQAQVFDHACTLLQKAIGYPFLKHIANSSGILRHPNYQYDMVRLGIGLYGVDSSSSDQLHLQTVATLKTTIAQIRKVKKGETIGYNRRGVTTQDSIIATIRIGYADGFNRKLGLGNGSVYLHGKAAPIIGNVCMDLTMVDITNIPEAQENDVVEIFGKNIMVKNVAEECQTIAYEILTSVGRRVKRVYVEE